LLYAPSASVLVRCSDLARRRDQGKEDERILSVGDPAFDPQQHPDLRRLASAAIEAKAIAEFYSDPLVFIDRDAQKSRIEPALAQADVIHFATHYLADAFSQGNSRLLLASWPVIRNRNPASDLSLQEIQASHLPKTKLVILAACQSGVERYYAGEGLIGLSRAFVEAGAPLVVASQWAVESDSSAKLMTELHQLRKVQGLSTTEALRQAQRDMLNSKDELYRRPVYWAAFFSIGGHAQY